MYFYSLIENCQLRIAAPKFEFGCGFYFCVIGALKYIIELFYFPNSLHKHAISGKPYI